MIEDTWQFLVYMVLATTTVLWIIVLFGCAQDPPSPIQSYREAYGVNPR
jgi:hypothetical protein